MFTDGRGNIYHPDEEMHSLDKRGTGRARTAALGDNPVEVRSRREYV